MIQVIGIKLSPPQPHLQHIQNLKYVQNQEEKICTRSQMVTYLNEGNKAYVARNGYMVYLQAVNNVNPPYVKTEPDRTTQDNLLALPTF